MSRFDEHTVHSDAVYPLDNSKTSSERTVDIGSRIGMSKEAARAEMDRFRGVAEYETRKVLGQRSLLKQAIPARPIEQPTPTKKKPSKQVPTAEVATTEPSQQMEIFNHAASR